MKIQAILNGEVVTIGHIEFMGSEVSIAYTNSSGVLLGTKVPFFTTTTSAGAFSPVVLATSGFIID